MTNWKYMLLAGAVATPSGIAAWPARDVEAPAIGRSA